MTAAGGSRVSVIVPSYDSARYLAATLEAILAQTSTPGEVVVADDGSTDDSIAIARSYAPDVTVLSGPHTGAAAARQRGLLATSGELVACCDADDLWMPTKLERQIAVLDADGDLDAVGCLADEFLSPDADRSALPGRGMRREATALGASALLVRRAFLTGTSGYLAERGLGESVDWFAAATRAGLRVSVVDEVLVRRRIHATNTSRAFDRDGPAAYLRIIRRHIEQRRIERP